MAANREESLDIISAGIITAGSLRESIKHLPDDLVIQVGLVAPEEDSDRVHYAVATCIAHILGDYVILSDPNVLGLPGG